MEIRIYGMTNAGSYGSSLGGPMVLIRFSAFLTKHEKYGYDELHLFLGDGADIIVAPIEADQLRGLAQQLYDLAEEITRNGMISQHQT